jgi:hypothetical protein
MLIHEMHYDFKIKANSIDSNKFSNFNVPEIDWVLNEAERIFVKTIAFPRYKSPVNFEVNQRIKSDIHKIVINDKNFFTNVVPFDNNSYIYRTDQLNPPFWFFLSGKVLAEKNGCIKEIDLFEVSHGLLLDKDPFSSSNFEWEEVNFTLISEGLKITTDGTFNITGVKLNYIRELPYMHNAQDHRNNTYNLLATGDTLTGRQNSLFSYSREICSEIVDIAVELAHMDLSDPRFQTSQYKNKIYNN